MARIPIPTRSFAAALIAGACIGAGGGIGTYAALSSGNETVVREVPVGASAASNNSSALSVNSIYQLVRRGVVEVSVTGQVEGPFGERQQQRAGGSGFVYDAEGHIVTNEHVVDGADSVSVTLWNGETYDAKVVGTDASTDLAVLKIEDAGADLFPVSLGDSDRLAVGDPVVAIGSPFGLAQTVTTGIVSALHREMTAPNGFAIDDAIQTDAAINHGNSGGPLLNGRGKVIGVNAQIRSDSGGNDGIGFAIPANTVRSIVSQLIETGRAEHAFLGIGLQDAESGTGAAVTEVRPGTPADDAGLRVGDVITKVDDRRITSGDELRAAINAHAPGDTVSLTYRRGGDTHKVEVKLTNRPS